MELHKVASAFPYRVSVICREVMSRAGGPSVREGVVGVKKGLRGLIVALELMGAVGLGERPSYPKTAADSSGYISRPLHELRGGYNSVRHQLCQSSALFMRSYPSFSFHHHNPFTISYFLFATHAIPGLNFKVYLYKRLTCISYSDL